jgi:hypothetical protein
MLSLLGASAYRLGSCSVLISREEVKERGVFVRRWHLSISHRARYCSPALRVAKSLANGRPGEGKRGTCIRFRDGPNEARS